MAAHEPEISLRAGWQEKIAALRYRNLFPHPHERDLNYDSVLKRFFQFLDEESAIGRSSSQVDYSSYQKRNEALKEFFRDHPALKFLLDCHRSVQGRVNKYFEEESNDISGRIKDILKTLGITEDTFYKLAIQEKLSLKTILISLKKVLVEDIYCRNKSFVGHIQSAKKSIDHLILETGKGELTLVSNDIKTELDLLERVVQSILRNIEVVDEKSQDMEERVKKLAMDTCEAIQRIFGKNGVES